MSDGWVSIRLGDACIKVGSGATPRGGKEVYVTDGPVALIRSQNVHNDRFDRAGLAYIADEQAIFLNNVIVEPDDVLLNITGDSVARCAQVDTQILPARVNQHVAIIRPDPTRLDARFLRYFLTAPQTQRHLLQLAFAGATRPALTKAMIESLWVFAPVLASAQRTISSILGALDDKIELNRKMSATLEAMARALFKSWFVDFDPVRAKAEGRDPGLPAEIAALFPDSFDQSELGEIPKGWAIKSIDAIASASRSAISPADYSGASFCHFSIPAFDAGQLPAIEIGAEIKSNKFLVPADAILISRLNPKTPRVWMPHVADSAQRSICSTEFAVMNPRLVSREWLYCLFCSSEFSNIFATLVTGTSGSHQRVKPDSLARMQLVVPPGPIAEQFTSTANPLLSRMNHSLNESKTLAELRDALLPKLISGEIRVSEAERIVEKSA